MDNITEIIEKIGLSKKEAQIYVALLRLGKASASLVAKNSGLKRPTTYLIIEDLRKKGLVLKMPGDKKQMFFAKSPEDIIYNAKKNVDNAFSALPILMNMFNQNNDKVRTIHYDGISGIKEALWYKVDTLKNKEVLGFFGSTDDASKNLVEIFHEWNAELASRGIKIRSIVPNSNNLGEFRKNDDKYGFKPKILPKESYSSKTSIEITEKFIRIVMFKEEQAVIIENPVVAATMKEIFELVWKENSSS